MKKVVLEEKEFFEKLIEESGGDWTKDNVPNLDSVYGGDGTVYIKKGSEADILETKKGEV